MPVHSRISRSSSKLALTAILIALRRLQKCRSRISQVPATENSQDLIFGNSSEHPNLPCLIFLLPPRLSFRSSIKASTKGDVIVSFDGVHVGSEGTVPFRSTERIAFRYLISQKFSGDVADLGIIRDGTPMKVQTIVQPRVHLVPYHIEGGQPSYLIVAGLVFTPLSEPLIEEECEDAIGLKLLAKARYSLARFEGEEIVILSQVLANEVNIGYEDMGNQQVMKCNGTPIKNIRHLAHLVDTCEDRYLIFEFEDNLLAVLEREVAVTASSSILKDYGIPSERSSDLFEPYVDLEGDNQVPTQEIGDSPVTNLEIGFDGLLWA